MIHFIPIDSQLEFALEPFLYPQNIILYNKYIGQVIIDLELMLRPQEINRMNWHQVTKRVTERLRYEGDQSRALQEIPQLNYTMEYVTTYLQEIPQRIR